MISGDDVDARTRNPGARSTLDGRTGTLDLWPWRKLDGDGDGDVRLGKSGSRFNYELLSPRTFHTKAPFHPCFRAYHSTAHILYILAVLPPEKFRETGPNVLFHYCVTEAK
jgi:hypothetical protein